MNAGNKLAESTSFAVGTYIATTPADTSFDGLSRQAAYVRDNWGVCDGLDEAPATIAARLNIIGTRKVRTNFFANGTRPFAEVPGFLEGLERPCGTSCRPSPVYVANERQRRLRTFKIKD